MNAGTAETSFLQKQVCNRIIFVSDFAKVDELGRITDKAMKLFKVLTNFSAPKITGN